MFCSNCGKELKDDAKFCDGCGAKVEKNAPKEEPEKNDKPVKEGKVFKCPHCGEILPYDAVKCPTCGNEIRGREANSTVQAFFDKLSEVEDDDKKIELIKTYPVPNSREAILEFMFLASGAFDAKYYATNKRKVSVSSAWLAKIDQCYQKAEVMFKDKEDLAQAKNIYKKVHADVKKISKARLGLLIGGFGLSAIGLIMVGVAGDVKPVSYVGICLLVIGIVGIVFGFKRKKTNKEIEQEKAEKARKDELKLAKMQKDGKAPQKQVVVHETKIVHEQAEPKVVYVDRPDPTPVPAPAPVAEPAVEAPRSEVRGGAVSYPREEVEVSPMFALKQGEKVLLKVDDLYMNDDGESYNIVVTNQAVYYLQTDGYDVEECTRIPLCQIDQVIWHKGGFLDDKYMEIFREGASDHIDEDKMLPILELAINERFDSATVDHDFRYYSKLNPKDFK